MDPTEHIFLQRIERADHLVAAQRLRVRRLESSGFDIAQPQALLRLMEAIADQFRTAWLLYRRHQPSLPMPSRQPLTVPAAALAILPCPHCGLALSLDPNDGYTVRYEISLWRQQCRHQRLQTPVLCQLLPSSGQAVH